jgi:hypothetical protein
MLRGILPPRGTSSSQRIATSVGGAAQFVQDPPGREVISGMLLFGDMLLQSTNNSATSLQAGQLTGIEMRGESACLISVSCYNAMSEHLMLPKLDMKIGDGTY